VFRHSVRERLALHGWELDQVGPNWTKFRWTSKWCRFQIIDF